MNWGYTRDTSFAHFWSLWQTTNLYNSTTMKSFLLPTLAGVEWHFHLRPCVHTTWNGLGIPFFLVYDYPSIQLQLFAGGILEKLYFTHLLWRCSMFLPGNLASFAICGFWVWKPAQFRKLGRGDHYSIGMVVHYLLIFCLHRLSDILGDCPPVLPLGSIQHLHSFMQPRHPDHVVTISAPILQSHLAIYHLGILSSTLPSRSPVLEQHLQWSTLFFRVSGDASASPPPCSSSFVKWCTPRDFPWNSQMEYLLVFCSTWLSIAWPLLSASWCHCLLPDVGVLVSLLHLVWTFLSLSQQQRLWQDIKSWIIENYCHVDKLSISQLYVPNSWSRHPEDPTTISATFWLDLAVILWSGLVSFIRLSTFVLGLGCDIETLFVFVTSGKAKLDSERSLYGLMRWRPLHHLQTRGER